MQTLTMNYTVAANSFATYEVTPPQVNGYKCIMAVAKWTSEYDVIFADASLSGIKLKNLSGTSKSNTCALQLLYIRDI